MRHEKIPSFMVAGDPATRSKIERNAQSICELADLMRLRIKAPAQEIFEAALEATREKDAVTARRAKCLFGLYGANCIGKPSPLAGVGCGAFLLALSRWVQPVKNAGGRLLRAPHFCYPL